MYFIKFAAGPTTRLSLRHVTMVDNHALDGEAIGGGAKILISNSILIGSAGGSRCYLQRLRDANLIQDGRCDGDAIDGDLVLGDLMEGDGYHPLPQGSPRHRRRRSRLLPADRPTRQPAPGWRRLRSRRN